MIDQINEWMNERAWTDGQMDGWMICSLVGSLAGQMAGLVQLDDGQQLMLLLRATGCVATAAAADAILANMVNSHLYTKLTICDLRVSVCVHDCVCLIF